VKSFYKILFQTFIFLLINNIAMISRGIKSRFFTILLAFLTFAQISFAADPAKGKELFVNNCAQCHAKDMKTKLTGPALAGVEAKWGDKPSLYKWIRNSQAMIASGDPRAVAIWNEYKPTVMNNFPNLKDEEIDNILAYIDKQTKGGDAPTTAVAGAAGADSDKKESNTLLYGVVLAVLSLLAVLMAQLISRLKAAALVKEGYSDVKQGTLAQIFTSKSVIAFLVFALVVLGGYTTVNNAISTGRQQGYAPDQPIKFSHATHAGVQKIECQYCHDSARRSKHSSIPGTNTCMNCHSAIKVGSKYGTAELTKIYASIGWDPVSTKYIDNYDNMSEQEVESVFKKWIASQYLEKKGMKELDKSGELVVNAQWEDVKTSLTNETKPKVQGQVEWVRIHNLPDHAYFNHAQHVAVGKIACQTCHGKVEKMEVMQQHSPLSMGWCINCHRQTNVQFKENAYYNSYKRYHEELKNGKRDNVKVEDIGGLECQKCHY
jgi:mono/diheme cytochrome c family protein